MSANHDILRADRKAAGDTVPFSFHGGQMACSYPPNLTCDFFECDVRSDLKLVGDELLCLVHR